MVITRVAPLSCAKVAGLLYLFLGLIVGAVVSIVSLAGAAAGDGQNMFPGVFGVAAIVIFPIFYACGGFVMTLIMTWLFNRVVGITGGIELDMR